MNRRCSGQARFGLLAALIMEAQLAVFIVTVQGGRVGVNGGDAWDTVYPASSPGHQTVWVPTQQSSAGCHMPDTEWEVWWSRVHRCTLIHIHSVLTLIRAYVCRQCGTCRLLISAEFSSNRPLLSLMVGAIGGDSGEEDTRWKWREESMESSKEDIRDVGCEAILIGLHSFD